MTLGALSFFHRRPHRRSAVVKADSLGQLESSSGGDQSHAARSSSCDTLLGRAQEGSHPQNTVFKVIQLRKESTAAGQPPARPSHDSILDSGWAGASDPSYSNRPSLDGVRSTSPSSSSVGPLMEREFDATSAPSCSARSSLDLEGPCCPCYASCGCTRSARSSLDCSGGRLLPAARRLMLQQPACSCARAGERLLLGGAAAVSTAARAGSLPAEVPGAGFMGSGSDNSDSTSSGADRSGGQGQQLKEGEEQLHDGERGAAAWPLGEFCTATRPAAASGAQSIPSRSSSLKSSIAALAVLRAAARSAVDGASGGGRGGPGLPRAVPSAAAEIVADLWAGASSCPTGGMLGRETDGESAAASVADSSRAHSQAPSRVGSGMFGLPVIAEGQVSQPQQQEEHGSGQEEQGQAQHRERAAKSPPKSPFFAASRLAAAGVDSGAVGGSANGSARTGSPHPSLPYEQQHLLEQQQQQVLRQGSQAALAALSSLPGTINVSKTPHSTAALLELFKAQQQGQGEGQMSGARSVASALASPPGYSPLGGTPNVSGGTEQPEHKLTMEVHGTYGCHIMEDRPCHSLGPAGQASLEDAIHAASRLHRSSIDLLLNQGPPAVVMVQQRRPSMELPELLGPPARPGQQAKDSRLSLDSNSSRTSRGGGRRSGGLMTAASALLPSQAHARSNGSLASAVSFMTPQQRSQLPGQLPGGAAGAEVSDPRDTPAAASAFAEVDKALPRGMLHAASTNMLADLSPNDFMGVTSPTAATAASTAALGLGPSASAFASSVVDTASGALGEASFNSKRRSEGSGPMMVRTPQELWLSPELHDTFGAHALCPPEPAVPSTPPASPYGGAGGGLLAGGAAAGRRPSPGASSPRMHQRYGPDAFGVKGQQQQPTFGGSLLCGQRQASAAAAGSSQAGAGGRPESRGGGGAAAAAAGIGSPGRPSRAQAAAKLHHPATVPGQQSVMMTDPQNSVPPLECLRQRRAARQRLDSEGLSSGGGYIAEAKRVLSQAMSSADPLETLLVQSSHSGAIGPLLRHLSQMKDDDAALRAGLHTLSLIITNSPNKSIIISFKGQQMLFDILYSTKDLEIQEDIVQLLWDLESTAEVTSSKDCVPDVKCFYAFLSILERTRRPAIASHVIHFMYGFRHIPCPGHILAEGARRLVGVVGAYRYHLPDAAQYTVGLLLAAMLDEPVMTEHDEHAVADQLLHLLAAPRSSAQCQAVLTLLSCISANTRARAALSHCNARAKLLQFGQGVGDARLRARALSLVKVLNKQEWALHP